MSWLKSFLRIQNEAFDQCPAPMKSPKPLKFTVQDLESHLKLFLFDVQVFCGVADHTDQSNWDN